jgi:enterochelin esterase-like enzyme
MPPSRTTDAPVVDGTGVILWVADPSRRLAAVRLIPDVDAGPDVAFARRAGFWRLRVPRPQVDRLEYLLEVRDHNGHQATITDPGNPLRARGAFGDKSVVQFPGYREPDWLASATTPHSTQPLQLRTRQRSITVEGALWSPDRLAAGEPAPLLVVHDGPEYAALGSFTQYLGALIEAGDLPVLRAALLAPGDRNAWYAANPAYAKALCTDVLPALAERAPATVRIGVGVSLGALAMLHAHRMFPSCFDGLVLQSGSFFTPELDPQERGFSGFARVTRFVARIEQDAGVGVPTTITCGGPEENLANNRSMARVLARQGYPVDFREVRDGHNFTAWRDALHPAATELLSSVAGAHAS